MTTGSSFQDRTIIPSRCSICRRSSNYTTLQMHTPVPSFLLLLRHSSSSIGKVYSVVVSRNNRYVISGSEDKSIKVFDLQTKQQLHHIADAHTGIIIPSLLRHSSSFVEAVRSVAVSNDNKFIISGSEDESIKVFDLQTKQQLYHFANAHQSTIILILCHSCSFIEAVLSVAVSSDNRFIVSGSSDKSIKVFDLQIKQQLHHFADAHQGTIILPSILPLILFDRANMFGGGVERQ